MIQKKISKPLSVEDKIKRKVVSEINRRIRILSKRIIPKGGTYYCSSVFIAETEARLKELRALKRNIYKIKPSF